jgi:hypothetical protein
LQTGDGSSLTRAEKTSLLAALVPVCFCVLKALLKKFIFIFIFFFTSN